MEENYNQKSSEIESMSFEEIKLRTLESISLAQDCYTKGKIDDYMTYLKTAESELTEYNNFHRENTKDLEQRERLSHLVNLTKHLGNI